MTEFKFAFNAVQPAGARPPSPANLSLDPTAITDHDNGRMANQTPAPVQVVQSAVVDFTKRQTTQPGTFGTFQKAIGQQSAFGQPFGSAAQNLAAGAASEKAEELARKTQDLLRRVQPKRKVMASWLFDEFYSKLSYEELQELRTRPLGNVSRLKLQDDEPLNIRFEKIETAQSATHANVFDWSVKPEPVVAKQDTFQLDIAATTQTSFVPPAQQKQFQSFQNFKKSFLGPSANQDLPEVQQTAIFQAPQALDVVPKPTSQLQIERDRIQEQLDALLLTDGSWSLEPQPQELTEEVRGLTVKNRFGSIQFSSSIPIESIDLNQIRIEDRYFDVHIDFVSYIAVLYNVQSSSNLKQQCQQRGLELVACEGGRLIVKK